MTFDDRPWDVNFDDLDPDFEATLDDPVEVFDLSVLPPSRNGRGAHRHYGPDRYHGRHVDLVPLLAAPPKPIPWRVGALVADGTLTVLAGESGSGKSWFAQALCSGVARGVAVAGLPCTQGRALYVDAEMGPVMFVDQRLRAAGVTVPEFEYIDAMGLDVSTADLDWLRAKITETAANLVVIDSMRRLVPSKAENDSDDMAPVVAAIAKLARDTGAAILLIHHKGDSDKFYRGSTAIRDQADALFGLLRDDDDSAIRTLRCRGGSGKMRYAPEPPDVYLAISPIDGGVAAGDEPTVRRQAPMRAVVRAAILAALPAKTKTAVAVKLGRRGDDPTFRAAWAELEDAGEISRIDGGWKSCGGRHSLGPPLPPQLFAEAATSEEEALAERILAEHEDSDGRAS